MNVSDERKFLHDLASPLGIAYLLTESVLDEIQGRADAHADDVIQIGRIHEALNRMKVLLEERRELLILRGVPSAKT